MSNITKIRSLIDENFSLQWCRDNLVIPLSIEASLPPGRQRLKVAVGNITYLGTITDMNAYSKKNQQKRFHYYLMLPQNRGYLIVKE